MEYAARLLVFDLDGTLVDSKEDLANAVNVALESFDLPPLPNPVIYSYVGDGASALILRALPKEKADLLPEVLDRFLGYYRRHLLDTTRAYPGVGGALLASLLATIDPKMFTFVLTFNVLMIVVTGGVADISPADRHQGRGNQIYTQIGTSPIKASP